MASTSETGHARNLAAFEQLISFCRGYGNRYNPSRVALQLSNLDYVLNDARNNLQAVKAAEAAYNNATHARAGLYKPLRPLATRIMNALMASEISTVGLAAARSIINKLQSRGKKKKETPEATEGEENPVETPRTISRSQASYDNQVDHFEKLVELLATEPGYQPYEPELSLAGLRQMVTRLHNANTAVVNANTTLSNARLQRDEVFYSKPAGMVALALNAKNYVKSVFSATSQEYKQVRGLPIRTRTSKK